MKNTIALLFVALALTANAKSLDQYLAEGYEHLEHKFGGVHLYRSDHFGSQSVVQFPFGGLFSKEEHKTELYETWAKAAEDPESYRINPADIETCEESNRPDYFKFAPYLIGKLYASGDQSNYSTPCFEEGTVEMNILGESTIEVVHYVTKKKKLDCGDGYFYSTLFNYHVAAFYREGIHNIKFENLTPEEMEIIRTSGFLVFKTCDKVINVLPDLFKTLYLFLGGIGLDPNIPFFGSKPTEFEMEQNVKFIHDATGYQWQKRPEKSRKVVYDLDPKLVQSGDFFAITRFDGLDQIIEYGAGSHAGHSVMAIWVDDMLHIVESQAAWYWPRKGLQINPWDNWVKWANDAGFHVTWLPITKEAADKFNTTAALEWFRTVEGMPYGYHNFLWGWIDTTDKSYPPMLDPYALGPLFAIVEEISPISAREMFTLSMNMRLNTTNLTVAEIALEAGRRNLTYPDLYAIVEQDGWLYPDGYSYVCSAFVTAMWKAGGLFDNWTVNAVEFTPRDVYSMTYIQEKPEVPPSCQELDPENPYCQIMGIYRMEFPQISTVPPYDHMNEFCESQVPNYERVPLGC